MYFIKFDILKFKKPSQKLTLFTRFKKNQKSNRGFHRGPRFWPPFWPPQKTPEILDFGHFWPLFGPPQNPQNPQKPPKWPKFQKMALFDQICLFGQKLWRFDKQNPPFWPPLGDSPPPQKWPFLAPPGKIPKIALFSSFFGHFLVIFWECECHFSPLARLPISNNRVIRPQIWNLRRKRGFSVPPQVREMWVLNIWPQKPELLTYFC